MRLRKRLSDRGDTLVEVLVAVTVLGIGITGLVSALATQVSTTVINRDQAAQESLLVSAAEHVKSKRLTSACAASSTPSTWTTIPSADLPRIAPFTAQYSNVHQVGSIPCSELTAVSVRVTGGGFSTRSLDVVTRP